MSILTAIFLAVVIVRWLDIPATVLVVASPLVFMLAGVLGMAQGIA